MAFFDTWAKYIRNTDWLVNTALHPYHDWHADLATEYFRQFPEIEAQYVTQRDSAGIENAKRALINDIYKDKTYHQEPLYAYLLAVTYSIFGEDHRWVYFWQILMSAFTIMLVYLIGKKIFNPTAGLLSVLLVLFNGSITVFQMVLLRTTMTAFFTVLLLYLFVRLLENPAMRRNVLFGIASGFALLGQSIFILFIVPAWILFLWQQRKQLKSVIPPFAVNVGAMLLVMSPLFIRNIIADVPIASMASQGAMAYIPMNIQKAFPMESFYIDMPELARIRQETGGKMLKAVGECFKTFDDFSNFWRVYSQKINGLFMWFELPNNVNYYLFREIAPILKALPVSYYFIAPLGMAGMLMGIFRLRRKILPLVLMILVSMAPMLIAGNFARYRTPLVILFSLFAAYLLIEIITLFIQKKYKLAAISIGLIIPAFIYTSTTVPRDKFLYIAADFDTFYREHYIPLLSQKEAAADFPGYLKISTEMVDDLPDYFLSVPSSQPITQSNEAECSRHVALLLDSHHNILKYLKRDQEAAVFAERIRILVGRVEEYYSKVNGSR